MPVVACFTGSGFSCTGTITARHTSMPIREHAAKVDIRRGVVIAGYLAPTGAAWAQLHEDELMQNWELARDKQPLRSIQGLM